MLFDLESARKFYSDEEIIKELDRHIDVNGAINAGYTLEEIAEGVSTKPKPIEAPAPEPIQPVGQQPITPQIEPAPAETTVIQPEIGEQIEPPKYKSRGDVLYGEIGRGIKLTPSFIRGLAGSVIEFANIVPVASRALSGVGHALNVFQETGDIKNIPEAFKEGFGGEEAEGRIALEEAISKAADIVRGTPKTEEEMDQFKKANNVITAASVLQMVGAFGKPILARPSSAVKAALETEKKLIKAQKALKLSAETKKVEQPKIKPVEPPKPKEVPKVPEKKIEPQKPKEVDLKQKEKVVLKTPEQKFQEITKPKVTAKEISTEQKALKDLPKTYGKDFKPTLEEEVSSQAGFVNLYPKGGFRSRKQRVPEPAKRLHEEMVVAKQVRELELGKSINSVIKQIPKKKHRETILFDIEKTKIPDELRRPDLQKIASDPKLQPKLKKVSNEVQRHFNKQWEYMQKHLDNLSEQEIKNYVTHIWDIPGKKVDEAANWFTTRNRFLKKRFIKTYEEGIKRGYKPKTLDIAEIMHIHGQVVTKSTENLKFAKALKNLQTEDGVKLIQVASDKTPKDWLIYDHPALRKAIFKGKTEEGKVITQRVAIAAHPDLGPMMDSVFGQRFVGPKLDIKGIEFNPLHAYETLNAVAKNTQLKYSFFHPVALGETSVATLGPIRTAKILNPVKVFNAIRKNDFSIYGKNYSAAKDAVRDGVQIGATTDIQKAKFDAVLEGVANSLDKVHKNLGLPARGLIKVNKTWDKALWDYLHNELKVQGYQQVKINMLKNMQKKLKRAPNDKEIKVAGEEAAAFVNDTFGGQNWERLMTNPKSLQIAQWFFLSPDWQASTIKQALSITGIGNVSKTPYGVSLRRKMGRRFWAKAALYMYGGINMLNVAFTINDEAKRLKKNPSKHFADVMKDPKNITKYTMLGNDVGHKTHLFVGRYPDGKKRYIVWGKQFRELPELFYDKTAGEISPITAVKHKMGNKFSPMQQLFSQFMHDESVGGFENREQRDKHGWKWVRAFSKTAVQSPMPFSFPKTMKELKEWKDPRVWTRMAFPESKGMTYHKTKRLFKYALVTKKGEKYLGKIYRSAIENNLNAFDIYESAVRDLISEAKSEIRAETRQGEEAKTVEHKKEAIKLKLREEKQRFVIENWEMMLRSINERYKSDLYRLEQLGFRSK